MVNGKVAKASTTVKEGDYINIKFGQNELTVKVNKIAETSKKEDAINLYEVVKEDNI